ncbi:PAS domain-containing hybrid sensor histidine kinase/response regulator [Chitinophaga cymbidii]|uniref:histidine kinase n=1 Tax=Chitinophaga cymbidii TaxID=1096750 RepID=A0A512RL85_9BACT|nr:ATP-binding protein [Chitinophaga cymbidii]GEP96420.1 hypothetical protein CCY01nite_26800 [Chitinophaga cymbidii]
MDDRHMREVLELAPMGAFLSDLEGNCFFVNREWMCMSGLSFDASLGKGWLDVVHVEDREKLAAFMRQHFRHPFDVPDNGFRILHPQRGIRHLTVKVRIPLDANGQPLFVTGYVQDVTEERLNMLGLQELAGNLERLNQLLDISQEISKAGGWELNIATGEVFWTRQTYAIYGLPGNYVPTLDTSLDFFDEQDSALIRSTLAKSMQEKTAFIFEAKTTTPADERKWVRVIGVPFVKDGAVLRVRGAIMDITDRKEDELALIRAKDKAEDAAKSKSEFLSVMSHEMRTPLNGIIGITSLLQRDHTPEQAEYISNLSFSANHLLQLINDILDLHKIESRNMRLENTVTDLRELLEKIFGEFRPLAEAKNIRLNSGIHPGVPAQVLGDPLRLGQILHNLVSNAVKYTEEGAVTVAVHPLSVTPHKATLHFSVKDTGIGIPEELHEIVFESFRQAQQASFRKHPGTGLGLTITKKLIGLHNSRIFINSKANEGAEFYFDLTFDLPVQQSASRGTGWSSAIAGYEKKFAGMKVLFVEDNRVNVIVAKRQLEYFGIIPDCAENAADALELLKRHSYHMALLDLHMPEMDGYALADVVRKEYPDVHIVIFTADIMPEVRPRLAAMDIHDILSKPFMPQEMLHTLLRIAGMKSFHLG